MKTEDYIPIRIRRISERCPLELITLGLFDDFLCVQTSQHWDRLMRKMPTLSSTCPPFSWLTHRWTMQFTYSMFPLCMVKGIYVWLAEIGYRDSVMHVVFGNPDHYCRFGFEEESWTF